MHTMYCRRSNASFCGSGASVAGDDIGDLSCTTLRGRSGGTSVKFCLTNVPLKHNTGRWAYLCNNAVLRSLCCWGFSPGLHCALGEP